MYSCIFLIQYSIKLKGKTQVIPIKHTGAVAKTTEGARVTAAGGASADSAMRPISRAFGSNGPVAAGLLSARAYARFVGERW